MIQLGALPVAVLGIDALAGLSPMASRLSWLGWTIATSYAFLCLTSAFHESAHLTLTRWPLFDRFFGRFLGTAMGVPYSAYCAAHAWHHSSLNRPEDCELWPYSDPRASLWGRRAFVLFDLFFGPVSSPVVYGRIFFAPRLRRLLSAEERAVIRREYAIVVLAWAAILGWVAWRWSWARFSRAWLLPLWIAGLLQTGRKLTEHLGMKSFDPLLGSRTVLAGGLPTRICSFLNFDIFLQGPHHSHPQDPPGELTRKLRERQAKGGAFPVFATYRSAARDMLAHLWRNPGVGLNAGGSRVS